jgi:restriction endonuclease S subunit
MIMKLHDIADIKTGITFRNRLLDNLDGEIEVIQMRDINPDLTISDRLVRISNEQIKPKHFLQPGQLILLAKGKYTKACMIGQSDKRRVISSAFFSIRIKPTQKVLPEYLQWFLNLPQSESYFRSNASGTSMFSLPMSVLKNLDVAVPPLEVQERIVHLVNDREQEKATLIALQEKKDSYLQQVMLQEVYRD